MLTAVFLSAVGPYASHGQVVSDTNLSVPAPLDSNSTVSFNDSSAYYKDESGNYVPYPSDPYLYPSDYGFWLRFRFFFRFGYYGRRWYIHHPDSRPRYGASHGPHFMPGPRPAAAIGGVTHTSSTGARIAPANGTPRETGGVSHTPSGSSVMPRKSGFGSTMHKTASAHS